jgi:hypothetical protein
MKCGICGQTFPFDPDEVFAHALDNHDFDLVESLGYNRIVLPSSIHEYNLSGPRFLAKYSEYMDDLSRQIRQIGPSWKQKLRRLLKRYNCIECLFATNNSNDVMRHRYFTQHFIWDRSLKRMIDERTVCQDETEGALT